MKAFIAMVIAMGVVKQQDIQDYWSTNEVIRTPFFGQVMARNRFLVIMAFFHLADNGKALPRDHADYTPLQKLGDLQDLLCALRRFIYQANTSQSKKARFPGGEISPSGCTIQISRTSMVSNHSCCVTQRMGTVAAWKSTLASDVISRTKGLLITL